MNRASTKQGAVIATLPHVGSTHVIQLVTTELLRRGFSIVGARQLLAGEIITGFADRLKITRMISVGKNQDIEVENDETHRTRKSRTETVNNNETITIGSNRTLALLNAGFSGLGAQQVLHSQSVTNANDRQQLALVITEILGKRVR